MRLLFAALLIFVSLQTGCSSGGQKDMESRPEDSFAYHYNLGLVALESRNYQKAVEHFQASIKLNANIPRTHNELGICYLYLDQLTNAVSSFETALSLNPNMPETHNSLGIVHMRLGNVRQAEQQFNAALNSRDYQTPFIPLYNLGLMYVQQGYDKVALEKFQLALRDEDKVSMEYRIYINYQIGDIYYRGGAFSSSLQFFEKVVVLNPKLVDAALKAGISAEKLGKVELARSMFNRVISTAPASEAAVEARQHLNTLGK
jgi:Tfp pilus assembly protein PilF